MTQTEWRQLPIFPESGRRMTRGREPIVGIDDVSNCAWLRAADIVVGQHRTRRQARRWISSVHRRYPGCLLAVARQRRGRWCLLGLPARNLMVRGERFDIAAAEQLGRVIYRMWAERWQV